MCPFRHLSGEKTVVCKHWLRGLCKKGDLCEFLHEYDMARMPECYFYSKFGPACKHRHTRRVICTNYVVGFCPDGPLCKFVHPKTDMVMCTDHSKNSVALQRTITSSMPRDPELILKHEGLMMDLPHLQHLTVIRMMHERLKKLQDVACGGLRPLEQVTCFKCGERGHYANKCNKNRFGCQTRK
ncbi:putative cleavage and polyadenylation specificity factor subunit 4-like protein [Bombina bombina]|uniref:putative cleavage and polyadenylation specificity factor subunit 4-like protein n=1 Tax=Bombina bombina TaxID=8345 RepID=UPI00235A61C4|nr:putative cleavage and polyadenylation specificity factor subunit 4-like protein [Bombina bombina]